MHAKQNATPVSASTRRDFLKRATGAVAVASSANLFKTPVYGQNQAPSPGRVIGANDRIAVAVIGVGYGIGQDHIMGIQRDASKNNVVVAAGCDLYSQRRLWMQGQAAQYGRKMPEPLKETQVHTNYRRILEQNDVDAVVVATHDPWHAQISIEAMDSGKHVYCEKPMTRYLDEAFKVADTVKRTGRIFTLGSQGCSAGVWHKAAELVKAGTLGQLVWAQGYYCRNKADGEWNYTIEKETTPENLDWNAWLGPVKTRGPFSADQFHRWRKYFPYCGGLLGDLVPHRLLPLMLASGNPEFPVRVTSIGSKNVHSDKKTPGTPERDVPEHVQLTAEFPSGFMITVTTSTVSGRSPGFAIYGHKAVVEIGEVGLQTIPERPYSQEFEGLTQSERAEMGLDPIKALAVENVREHEKNWFECIRSGKQPNAGIDLALKAQTVISLAEMSERMKMTCLFDEKTRMVKDGNGKTIAPLTYGSVAGLS